MFTAKDLNLEGTIIGLGQGRTTDRHTQDLAATTDPADLITTNIDRQVVEVMNQGIAQEEMVTAVPKVVMDIDQAEVQAFIQAVRAFDRREMVTGQEAVQAEAHIVP